MSAPLDSRRPQLHFDCVFYYVRNIDLAIPFYRDVLGLKFISRDAVARFNIDGVLFELVPAAANDVQPSSGNARLCLRVDNVAQALNHLRAKGVRTGPPVDKGAGVLGTFEDPDGNEIYLWQYSSKP